MASWHGFAKLRMHTDSTLKLLDEWNTAFGRLIRRFERSTKDVKTVETPAEVAARNRRYESETAKSSFPARLPVTPNTIPPIPLRLPASTTPSAASTLSADAATPPKSIPLAPVRHHLSATSKKARTSGPQVKKFSLTTFKLHNRGHYVSAIRRAGTSDVWSTAIVRVSLFCVNNLSYPILLSSGRSISQICQAMVSSHKQSGI